MGDATLSHLIEIDENARLLRIHRVFPDGCRQLFTETPLPPPMTGLSGADRAAQATQYTEFARLIGENILSDSPAARRALRVT
jgi:hypothetical protein